MSCVPKKNWKLRLVLDCRRINKWMMTKKFKQESIESVMQLIQGDELITTDIKDGFHHLKIHVSSQKFLEIKWKDKFLCLDSFTIWCSMLALLF